MSAHLVRVWMGRLIVVLRVPLIGITVWVVEDACIGRRRRRRRLLVLIGIRCSGGGEGFGCRVSGSESRDFYEVSMRFE